jgi:hypothetical protein
MLMMLLLFVGELKLFAGGNDGAGTGHDDEC